MNCYSNNLKNSSKRQYKNLSFVNKLQTDCYNLSITDEMFQVIILCLKDIFLKKYINKNFHEKININSYVITGDNWGILIKNNYDCIISEFYTNSNNIIDSNLCYYYTCTKSLDLLNIR